MKRCSGILLPLFSLPSNYGIGTLGKESYNFIDFLEKSGQRVWQMLPVSPTGFGNSPYQSFSSFAGNPYFIDLDVLLEEGLLERNDLVQISCDAGRVDYGFQYSKRYEILRKAFSNFKDHKLLDDFKESRPEIEEFSLFMALKKENGNKEWYKWDEKIKRRDEKTLSLKRKELKDELYFNLFLQWEFFSQWERLKSYAESKDIKIFGDIPIYVSSDSCDVWKNPSLFCLDGDMKPSHVAGCPPDQFAKYGQKWGNPLYNWDKMKYDGYLWWGKRLNFSFSLFDIIRIDHFRGLESYYSIPSEDENAVNGKWIKGPGKDFIEFLKSEFKGKDIIAEDLGFLTDEVYSLLNSGGFPGMKVLQFAFDGKKENPYLPHKYKRHCAAYTGTHDNDTLKGWIENLKEGEELSVRKYLHGEKMSEEELCQTCIEAVLKSQADLAIIPLADYLGTGREGRINTPSESFGNWEWRFKKEDISDELAEKIKGLTEKYFR